MGIILEDSKRFPVGQKVVVDTNVLYWLTYANSRCFPSTLKPQKYQLESYPNLFEKLINNKNELYFSSYSVSELASIIAKVEASLSGYGKQYERKKWLKDKGGKEVVVKELETLVDTLNSWGNQLTVSPSISFNDYLVRYNQVNLDGYDINIEQQIRTNKIEFILSDDIDFVSVKELNVVTANRNVPKKLLI